MLRLILLLGALFWGAAAAQALPLPPPGDLTTPADCEAVAPDLETLPATVERQIERFVSRSRILYALVYREPRYNYTITNTAFADETAQVTLRYNGSIIEIRSGQRLRASGTITARFGWNGCAWVLQGVRFV